MENYQEYFARKARELKDAVAKETTENRQCRLQREQNAKSYRAPGNHSRAAKVFLWEQVEQSDFWIRTYVTRPEVEDVWSSDWTHAQLLFNPVDNEWNICEPMDTHTPSRIQNPYDSDDSDDDAPYLTVPESIMSNTVVSARILAPQAPPAFADQCRVYGESSHVNCWPTDTMLVALSRRYGFTGKLSNESYTVPEQPTWVDIQKMLGGRDAPLSQSLIGPVALFVHALLNYPSTRPSYEVWDLASAAFSPLTSYANTHIVVSDRILRGEHYYLIEPKDRGADGISNMSICTRDAATVLECFRVPLSLQRDITAFLLNNGRPFKTIAWAVKDGKQLLSDHYADRQRIDHLQLGWRTLGNTTLGQKTVHMF